MVSQTITSASQNVNSADGIVVEAKNIRPSTDPSGPDWKVTKSTLKGGVQAGVELIEVDNGRLQFTVIPTRGMSIYEMTCGETRLGWNSPVKQIVHPQHVNLNDRGGLGWLAGFNEFLVRCGVEFAGHPGDDNGTSLTLHGRIGNIPASEVSVVVDDEPPHRIRVLGKVEERSFKFGVFELWTEVSTLPGSNSIQIRDRLINKSEYDQEFQIIYHTNFGPPLLGKDSMFIAPVSTLAPLDDYAAKDLRTYGTYLGPTKNYGEQVYCLTLHSTERGHSKVMLRNADSTLAATMMYNAKSLPYFTLWKNTDTESDGYVTGLEPGTGFPYNRSIERKQKRVPILPPGDEVSFELDIELLAGADRIREAQNEIQAIESGKPRDVYPLPQLPE